MAKKILIVDDSASMRQLVTFTLKNEGYEVIAAEDGKDAISKLSVSKVDMVVTDLNMPNMNGIELIKQLRSSPDTRFIPVVMLTTEFQEGKKQEGAGAGASGWLVKPFSPDILLETVKRFVR